MFSTSRDLSTTRNDILFVKGGIEEVIFDAEHRGYKLLWWVVIMLYFLLSK
jgi:hypothetical protein